MDSGRIRGRGRKERVCQLCKTEVEDPSHALWRCAGLSQERDAGLADLKDGLEGMGEEGVKWWISFVGSTDDVKTCIVLGEVKEKNEIKKYIENWSESFLEKLDTGRNRQLFPPPSPSSSCPSILGGAYGLCTLVAL